MHNLIRYQGRNWGEEEGEEEEEEEKEEEEEPFCFVIDFFFISQESPRIP